MKLAIISDIHGNYLALNAVLEDIKKHNVDEIFCLGDLVGYAPDPNKVFPILKGIKTLMGNYDEATALSKDDCGCGYVDLKSSEMGKISFEWTVKNTTEENKKWIMGLPKEIRLNINNKKILMVHGTPDIINGRMDIMSDDKIDEVMKNTDADILFCGHTHIPYHKIVNGKHIINPGSVGRPRIGSPQANYAIVDFDKGCGVEFIFLDYDFESFAKEIENSDMPKNNFAEVIITGYWKW